MPTKAERKAQALAVQAASPEAQAPAPEAQAAATDEVQAPAPEVQAPAPEALPAGHVLLGGVPVKVAPSIAKRAASLANLPAKYAGVVYGPNPAKPSPRASGANSVHCWALVKAHLAAHGGQATGQDLANASTGDFVRFAVRSAWLAPVVQDAQQPGA